MQPGENSNSGNDEKYVTFMYDKVYDELNRSRDWPLKVLGFTSGLYISILGVLKLFSGNNPICDCEKIGLTVAILLFTSFCALVIIKQHLQYLRYRNIQIGLQKRMGLQSWKVGSKRVFPEKWEKDLKIEVFTNFYGWLFYVFYLIFLSLLAIYVIFKF